MSNDFSVHMVWFVICVESDLINLYGLKERTTIRYEIHVNDSS